MLPSRAERTFPEVVIEGDGFVLRPLRGSDVPDIAEACTDDETQRWLPLPRPYTTASAQWFVSDYAVAQCDSGDGVVMAIDVGGRLHGCIDLKKTDWVAGTSEIGYWVAPWGRGSGLAGRASHLLARWALREHGLERVEIRVATGNVPSQRAAERAGMVREGVLRNAGFVHDGRVDLAVYSLVRADLGPAPTGTAPGAHGDDAGRRRGRSRHAA